MTCDLFLALAVGSVTFLVLHLFFWRQYPSNSPRVMLLAGLALIGGIASMLMLYQRGGAIPLDYFAVAVIESFLFILYFLIYSALARSVSITLLIRLLAAGKSSVPFATLEKEYAESSRFEDRIQAMQAVGFVSIAGDTVTITERGTRLAHTVDCLGGILSEGLEG